MLIAERQLEHWEVLSLNNIDYLMGASLMSQLLMVCHMDLMEMRLNLDLMLLTFTKVEIEL